MNQLLSPRELATVLAALRYWQQDLADNDGDAISPDHFADGTEPLSVHEIDGLCERLNAGHRPPEGPTPMRVDVYLDTGVCVDVPDGTDLDSDEGLRTVKAAAKAALLELLNGDGFDVQAEEYRGG